MYKVMSPGPTKVAPNVRQARALEAPNPDFDPNFVDLYKTTCDAIGTLLGAAGPTYILSGEAILGLEAACASLTQPGSRVLVLANGVYGQYFADFVTLYGGEAVVANFDWHCGISPAALEETLQQDHDFAYATLVHCDTPSGVLNDVDALCKILHKYGIITVVDAVASSFAVPISTAVSCIDILCCGSQKALSAPAGITILCVSQNALQAMQARHTPIASYCANILQFTRYYEDKWFPYTMPSSCILGIQQAVQNLQEDPTCAQRHKKIAQAVRHAATNAGLALYLHKDFSPTVTALCLPEGITASSVTRQMLAEHNILVAGSVGVLQETVIRIGHMGENANPQDVEETLRALSLVLALPADMGALFSKELARLSAQLL